MTQDTRESIERVIKFCKRIRETTGTLRMPHDNSHTLADAADWHAENLTRALETDCYYGINGTRATARKERI